MARTLEADLENGLTPHELTPHEAARRLARDGPNELRSMPPVPAWRRILAQFQDPLIYLLLAAVAISLIAWAVQGRVGWPVDAIVIGDIRSFSINYEINAVLYSRPLAEQLERDFERDLVHCTEFDAAEYRSRNVAVRFRDSVARLFSPLLQALAAPGTRRPTPGLGAPGSGLRAPEPC